MDCPYDHDCWVCQKRYTCKEDNCKYYYDEDLWCPECRFTADPRRITKILIRRIRILENYIENLRNI